MAGKRMKRYLSSVLVIVGAVAIGGCAMLPGGGKSGKPVKVSDTPVMIGSVEQGLEAFRGKVVILDLWATWCGPCRVEIPGFVSLQNKYRDQGLEVIGVSLDPIDGRGGGAAAVAPFMKSYGINYTIWMVDNGAALNGYPPGQGIPTTYVLDRQGRIVKTYVGAKPMSVFENDIKQLL